MKISKSTGLPRGITFVGGRFRARRWIGASAYTVGNFTTLGLAAAALEAAMKYPAAEYMLAFPRATRRDSKPEPKVAPVPKAASKASPDWKALTTCWHVAVAGARPAYTVSLP